ncbi:MAG: molybdate ABC transporter substrate-binding protein [Christensenellaceae bacterium]|jgi:molybdate transport system substrate-binding protein|nr:molybdate ABC transporter substrate-binding protein [Christensenellaceae bacterium]
MKKFTTILIALLMTACLVAGCAAPAATPEPAAPVATPEPAPQEPAPTPEPEPVELIVFAAASMTETMTQIADLYKAVAPNVTIVYNFDSSGTLKTQIQEGADCDLFISAAQKQMNELDSSKDATVNPDALDFVLQGTRLNLLENKVALVVPEGNPKSIVSFADIANCDLIALGNSDVPVGQYSIEILTNLGLLEGLEKAKKISYGTNVKEVTTQVSEASVDCGIVYATDAFSAGLAVADLATADMCKQVIYPAAVLNVSKQQDAAKAFLAYLQSPDALAVFEGVGFAPAA